MTTELIWKNLVAYWMQVGLLVGLAAFVPAALRLRTPRAKLAYWQILLVACLMLPLVQTWRQEAITGTVQITSTVMALQPAGPAVPRRMPPSEIALWVLAAGAAARLVWLAAGFWRLRLYRRRSHAFVTATPWRTRAELRISDDISSPVTFGVWDPVVLLPAQFPELNRNTQDAILYHELLHVDRRDWLFTIAEELVRVVFWFHPAIWWLLGEIQLAREQAVDREVIDVTQARDEYVDALLAIAGARSQADLAPAPLFLRKRHLKQRVVSILKDGPMSRARLLSALAAGLGVLAMACWLVTSTFPLAAAPQIVSDGPGVAVEMGGAALLHRTPVRYPEAARAKGIQGIVVVEVTLDMRGTVSDAQVLSGPAELRKAALESVLGWHFAHESSGMRRQVTVGFQLPATRTESIAPETVGYATQQDRTASSPTDSSKALEVVQSYKRLRMQYEVATIRQRPVEVAEAEAKIAEFRKEFGSQIPEEPRFAMLGKTIKGFVLKGLSAEARADLLSRLPVRAGDVITADVVAGIVRSVKEFDEHLTVSSWNSANQVEFLIFATAAAPVGEPVRPERIRIGGDLQHSRLIHQTRPAYPSEAKQTRIQGVVKLTAVVAKDGAIKELEVISGHPLLVPATLEAVKNWVYEPTVLNGNPVEVVTQIDVNFTLSQ